MGIDFFKQYFIITFNIGYVIPAFDDVTDLDNVADVTLEEFVKSVNDDDDVTIAVRDTDGNVQWWQGSVGGNAMGRMGGWAGEKIGGYYGQRKGSYYGAKLGGSFGRKWGGRVGKYAGQKIGRMYGQYKGRKMGEKITNFFRRG